MTAILTLNWINCNTCSKLQRAIRQDGHPDWFVLTGLLHDLGKVLCLYGEPQWAVVGDTYPVGCQFSDKIVYSEFFAENPDYSDERLQHQAGYIFRKLWFGPGQNELGNTMNTFTMC